MPKVIQSTIEHFPGTVTLSDPLTMPQVLAIDEGLLSRRQYFEEKEIDGKRGYVLKAGSFWSQPDSVSLEVIMKCVDEWGLKNVPENVTAETFPGSPRTASKDLIDWLLNEILEVYQGEVEVPNE